MNPNDREQDQLERALAVKNEATMAPFDGSIRMIKPGDSAELRPILEEWIRDSGTGDIIQAEIDGFIVAMNQSAEGTSGRRYVVAETGEGRVVGVMGLAIPNYEISTYAKTTRPIEIVNGFVTNSWRGSGVGRRLYAEVEQLAQQQGYTEMLVTSGPRYEETGWPFWTGLFGPPVVVLQNYWGEDEHAPIWRKSLA